VNPITLKMPQRIELNRSELLDEKDIEKLINSCYHPRDSALISLMYEAGCRKGELLSLLNKNISFDEIGADVTFPKSKTKSRRIKVIWSASYLRVWKESHPLKDNPNAPFFCSLRTPTRPLSETGLRNQLEDIGIRADLKKHLYPHLMRHSRASKLAKHLSDSEMCTYLGWTQGSGQTRTYVHLAGEDVDDSILRMYGLEIQVKKEGELKVISCPRCKRTVPATSIFCSTCGLPLNETEAQKIEQTNADMNLELFKVALSDPAVQMDLLELMKKLK